MLVACPAERVLPAWVRCAQKWRCAFRFRYNFRVSSSKTDPLRPKGLVPARRLTVRRHEQHARLSLAAEESLFRAADYLFEGRQEAERFYGSFMMQVPLERLQRAWRNIPESDELRSLLEGSVRIRVRLARLALREAVARFPGEQLGTVEVESRFVVDERSVRIDLDLDAERIVLARVVDSE